MGLRSRDSIARANSVVNERAARRGVRGLKTTFRGKKRAGTDAEASAVGAGGVNATVVGKRKGGGGARIKWPDQASASEVRAPEEEEEEEAAEDARARREDEATTTGASGGDDVESSKPKPKSKPKRPPLETLIEYEVTESEGSLDKFQRLPSAGAGEHVGGYGDTDSDDSFDTEDDVRAMREAMRDLKYGENDTCCCVVQ